jgi:hypothetical protein
MSKYLIALLALLVTSAHAQQTQPPSDVDLKAAYCIAVTRASIVVMQNQLPNMPDDEKLKAVLQQQVSRKQTDLNRLQSYLFPKFSYIDPTGLALAAQRGNVDQQLAVKQFGMCIERCSGKISSREQWIACDASCDREEPATSRIKTCDQIDWLPF